MPGERERAQAARAALLDAILDAVDPRMAAREAFRAARRVAPAWPAASQQVVIVGHRASGKSRLLPLVAAWLRRKPLELDAFVSERAGGRDLREWVERDQPSFRRAERDAFLAAPAGRVIAAGGGFLSSHADLLRGHIALLVPVTFVTYRERLLDDPSRPRLRPELSEDDEIAQVYAERERVHGGVSTVPLLEFLAATLEEPA